MLSNPEEKKKYDEVLEKQQPRKQFYTYNNNRDYLKSCVDLLKQGNFEEVKDLLTRGKTSLDEILKVSADPSEGISYSILHWAAINNRVDIFEALELYIKDVHINDKGRVGQTPLHLAVYNNNVDVVKILLKIPDIDINASLESDYRSNSAIGCAKNAEMILMLVNAGADIESEKGKRDLTGVINNLIEEEKSEEVIKLLSDELLKDKIDLNTEAWYGDNDDGTTILEAATLKYNTKLLKVLSKHRPSANLKGINEPHYQDLIMCHLAKEHSKTKNKAEKNKIKVY
ncbi:MAG: ankyrin repeat domain-containing protein [Wolbachia endosymbiont of Xenopsylla cheopis]